LEAGGSGFRGGTGVRTLPNPADRGDFVTQIVGDFERRRMGVEGDVVGFIVAKVLVPDPEWIEGLRAGRFDPRWVAGMIDESLELAAERAERGDRLVVDVALAEPAFHEVLELRHECDFPFIFC
jgi:hypothetical protein